MSVHVSLKMAIQRSFQQFCDELLIVVLFLKLNGVYVMPPCFVRHDHSCCRSCSYMISIVCKNISPCHVLLSVFYLLSIIRWHGRKVQIDESPLVLEYKDRAASLDINIKLLILEHIRATTLNDKIQRLRLLGTQWPSTRICKGRWRITFKRLITFKDSFRTCSPLFVLSCTIFIVANSFKASRLFMREEYGYRRIRKKN